MFTGAVFFDIDGTLVDGKEGIFAPTVKTRGAIRLLKERGYLTALATGRAKCYLPQDLPEFDCYITCNGAYAEAGGTPVFNSTIEPGLLAGLRAYLEEAGFNYIIEGQQRCYCLDLQEYYFQRMVKLFHLPPHIFRPIAEYPGFPVNKLMITYQNDGQLPGFQDRFQAQFQLAAQPGNQAYDLGLTGVNKGAGVHAVLQHFGIFPENAYAFGDADNDLEMLREVGNGIAMGRHSAGLEQAAAFVTGTVREEGIATGLKHFGLIE